MKHKYHATPTETDGMKFASKLEAKHYKHLKWLKANGDIVFFLRQCPFHVPGNKKFVVDFVEFWADGNIRWVDCKGYETDMFKFKKALVEALYPITITVIK